jgi:outer membrane protein TolC
LSKGFTTQAHPDQAEAQMKTAQAQVEPAQARPQNTKDNLVAGEQPRMTALPMPNCDITSSLNHV